jgi:integrase
VPHLKTRRTRKEPHCVILTQPMLAILDVMAQLKLDETAYVFPGQRIRGGPLGDTVIRQLLASFGYAASPHGFRRSFKTWAHEQTRFNRLEIELGLAHAIPGVEGIYLDSDLREQRALLSRAWADFCLGLAPPRAANVVALRGSNMANSDGSLLAAPELS